MSARLARAAWAVALAALPRLAAAEPSPEAPAAADSLRLPRAAAPADSGLSEYLRSLADSTDVFFGPSSAPVDTAGLDSVLAFRLAHPDLMHDLRRPRTSFGPWLSFNRADGPLYGGVLTVGSLARKGALSGRLGYAVGPNQVLGGAAYRRRWGAPRRGEVVWTLEAQVGRFTALLDPDRYMSWPRVARAFLNGSDRHHYYRRDGLRAQLEREGSTWRALLGFRDQLEYPLATTTTWNLLRSTPELTLNRPAALGRATELLVEAALRVPRVRLQLDLTHRLASERLGGDFDYRRFHSVLGGDLPLDKLATLVPQLEYGRLTGDAVPQASFFLGGTHSLRSLPTNSHGGTRETFGRLEVVFAPDLLRVAGVPHPSFLQLQAALFAASGAVWGADPFGGPTLSGGVWPERAGWLSEVGGALLYRPGLPDPRGFFRLDYARGLGSRAQDRVTLHYSVPLDLIRPLP